MSYVIISYIKSGLRLADDLTSVFASTVWWIQYSGSIINEIKIYLIYFDMKFHGGSLTLAITYRLPPLGFRIRVSVTPCGFRGGWNEVWVGFSRGFSRFPLPQISFHHISTLISFILFRLISFHFIPYHPLLSWCVTCRRPAFLLFTDIQQRGFIAFHPSTQPCVGHELSIFWGITNPCVHNLPSCS